MKIPAGSSNFEDVQPGTYIARCWRVIDLGTQETNFNGEVKAFRKVLITWELVSEKMSDGRPFTVGTRYTLSGHPKSNLIKMLAGWRGRQFSPADLESFRLDSILGKPCMITLVQNAKGYTDVASVSPPPAGIAVPQGENESYYLSLERDEFRPDVFATLSEKLQATIQASPEYASLNNRAAAKPVAAVKPAVAVGDDDDIPF